MKNNLRSISANYKLDFYLDKNNINNQELVRSTISHFEHIRNNIFKPVAFLNLLRKQCEFVLDNPNQPKETFKILKELPLTVEQKHILYYFIIEWFGGVGNMSHKRTLRLIENEFKKYKKKSPEKELYFKGVPEFYKLTFNQIKKVKSGFDKLTYPEKLIFWNDNIIKDFHYSSSSIGFFLENETEIENEGITPEKCITIYPKDKTEIELHNHWLYNHIITDKGNRYFNFEKLKEKYFETINNNPRAKEYTEQEIEAIKKRRNKEKLLMEGNSSIYFWGYYSGYQSVVKNENSYLELSAFDFKRIVANYAKGVASAHYLGFLEMQLEQLKQGGGIIQQPKTPLIAKAMANVNQDKFTITSKPPKKMRDSTIKRHAEIEATFNRFKKLPYNKQVKKTCEAYGISEKTLERIVGKK